MKIKQEHYDHIRSAIVNILEGRGVNPQVPPLAEYEKAGMSAKRWRWDLLWSANLSPWICKNIYPYANDDHIDTALRRITDTK